MGRRSPPGGLPRRPPKKDPSPARTIIGHQHRSWRHTRAALQSRRCADPGAWDESVAQVAGDVVRAITFVRQVDL